VKSADEAVEEDVEDLRRVDVGGEQTSREAVPKDV
jgi:hypothetical protein